LLYSSAVNFLFIIAKLLRELEYDTGGVKEGGDIFHDSKGEWSVNIATLLLALRHLNFNLHARKSSVFMQEKKG
jgi:hypothetical protein